MCPILHPSRPHSASNDFVTFRKIGALSPGWAEQRGTWAAVGVEVVPIGTLPEAGLTQNRLCAQEWFSNFIWEGWLEGPHGGHPSTYSWGYPALIFK